jgi:hypothetical protein
MGANEFAMAAAGDAAEARCKLLDHVKDRYEEKKEREQAVAPPRAGLRRDYDIAGIRIGQHDQKAGAQSGQKSQ